MAFVCCSSRCSIPAVADEKTGTQTKRRKEPHLAEGTGRESKNAGVGGAWVFPRPVVLKLLWTTKQVGKIFENSPQKNVHKNSRLETPLVVQWLRLQAPNAGCLDLIPGLGTRSHILQPRVHMPQLKITRATSKTQHCQINKYLKQTKPRICM